MGQLAAKSVVHAATQGAIAQAAGGDFRSAALGGFAGSFVGGSISGMNNPAAEIAITAIAGGTVSELTGGKFANGAITAAMVYTFNGLSHMALGKLAEWRFQRYLNDNFPGRFEFQRTGLFGFGRTDIYDTRTNTIAELKPISYMDGANYLKATAQIGSYGYAKMDTNEIFLGSSQISLRGNLFDGSVYYTYYQDPKFLLAGKPTGLIFYEYEQLNIRYRDFRELNRSNSNNWESNSGYVPIPFIPVPVF